MTRKFRVTIERTVELEVDEKVIAAVDDEWRSEIYNLRTPEDIAGHIAYNMLVNNIYLSSIDGFANFPDKYVNIIDDNDVYIDADELK